MVVQTALNSGVRLNTPAGNLTQQLLTTTVPGVTGPIAFDSTGERVGMLFTAVLREASDVNIRSLGTVEQGKVSNSVTRNIRIVQAVPEVGYLVKLCTHFC
jgi:hypothetical protein